MSLNPWLPMGFELPGGVQSKAALFEGADWQIVSLKTGLKKAYGRGLLARESLVDRWTRTGLVEDSVFQNVSFGSNVFRFLLSASEYSVVPIPESESPSSKIEALAFATSLKATREIDKTSSLHDAIYCERISRLLPTFTISPRVDDDVVLGYWLTGGAPTSVKSFRRLSQMLTWLPQDQLKVVVEASGILIPEISVDGATSGTVSQTSTRPGATKQVPDGGKREEFNLPGREALESFFRDHVIDIVQNRDRYKALGIEFPSAIVLHGPPGTGKTFAVEKLVEYLGWPSYRMDAGSLASPYIHETSRKVAEMFDVAIQNSPSVLVIDEMEAFLADREAGVGQHRVEELAEFLRRIPEATKNGVLIVAMTNRLDMIDSAILRRGRFDHVIEVGFASVEEVNTLLVSMLQKLSTEPDVDPTPIANGLRGRPLSDVAFVVREGGRLAARSGRSKLDQVSLVSALSNIPEAGDAPSRRIGFV